MWFLHPGAPPIPSGPLSEALQGRHGGLELRDGVGEGLHALPADVVLRAWTEDGPDLQRRCLTHGWASGVWHSAEGLDRCPECQAAIEIASGAGRRRFLELQRLLSAE